MCLPEKLSSVFGDIKTHRFTVGLFTLAHALMSHYQNVGQNEAHHIANNTVL
jgi:ubiquinone biosynthesis protein UbiJ